MSGLSHLECSLCGKRFEQGRVLNLCDCGGPLLVRYDLESLRRRWSRDQVAQGPNSMWRYAPALPPRAESIVSLGEGMTPLICTRRLGARVGADDLWVKDEGLNPTGSFKARGLSCAISMAVELGIKKVAIPSAGNAASAMAAYAAAAGIQSHIFMPQDVPQSNYIECKAFGSKVTLVDGLISDCAKIVNAGRETEGWFDVSTLKEPYRIEGKKTMGYELAEQMGWKLPDAILYPTGGGTGLIGMWKAFREMEEMGYLGPGRPRMYAVQAEGCAPIVKAFSEGLEEAPLWENAHTLAHGIRVPKALGDFLILRALRESHGAGVTVSDPEIVQGVKDASAQEGLFMAPEGGACVAALRKLKASGQINADDTVVLFNTGTGFKYV